MVPSKQNIDREIPGLKADAYASSANHLAATEEFGRKWYAAGVKTGLAQAKEEAETRVTPAVNTCSEETQDNTAALVARNNELEKQVKELQYRMSLAIQGLDILTSYANYFTSIVQGRAIPLPDWFAKVLNDCCQHIENNKNQCNAGIDQPSQNSNN